MSAPPPSSDAFHASAEIVEIPWSARRYASLALDAAGPLPPPSVVVERITRAARAAADAYALDGLRLRASPRAIRPLLRAGWRFWHFGCVRRIDSNRPLPPLDGLIVRVGGNDGIDTILDPLAASLRAGIPVCEAAWRDAHDFKAAAERWLSDFLARGDLLVRMLERDTTVAYGLLSVSGRHAMLEDVSVLPEYAGRGLSEVLLGRIEGLAREHGFDALRATLMHAQAGVRRRLAHRLKAEGWRFDEAHFSLPVSVAG